MGNQFNIFQCNQRLIGIKKRFKTLRHLHSFNLTCDCKSFSNYRMKDLYLHTLNLTQILESLDKQIINIDADNPEQLLQLVKKLGSAHHHLLYLESESYNRDYNSFSAFLEFFTTADNAHLLPKEMVLLFNTCREQNYRVEVLSAFPIRAFSSPAESLPKSTLEYVSLRIYGDFAYQFYKQFHGIQYCQHHKPSQYYLSVYPDIEHTLHSPLTSHSLKISTYHSYNHSNALEGSAIPLIKNGIYLVDPDTKAAAFSHYLPSKHQNREQALAFLRSKIHYWAYLAPHEYNVMAELQTETYQLQQKILKRS